MAKQDVEKRDLEDVRMTMIWISPDAYQRLLQVEMILITKNNRSINPSDAVTELIEFWEKHRCLKLHV